MDYSAITGLLSPELLAIISGVCTVAYTIALAATKLPPATAASSTFYKVARAIVDFIAANYGNAKNAKVG
jgi:hypothetical protein